MKMIKNQPEQTEGNTVLVIFDKTGNGNTKLKPELKIRYQNRIRFDTTTTSFINLFMELVEKDPRPGSVVLRNRPEKHSYLLTY